MIADYLSYQDNTKRLLNSHKSKKSNYWIFENRVQLFLSVLINWSFSGIRKKSFVGVKRKLTFAKIEQRLFNDPIGHGCQLPSCGASRECYFHMLIGVSEH